MSNAASSAADGKTGAAHHNQHLDQSIDAFSGDVFSLRGVAARSIDAWVRDIEASEVPALKPVADELHRLKEHLAADELDGQAIKTSQHKLGEMTTKSADDAEGAR